MNITLIQVIVILVFSVLKQRVLVIFQVGFFQLGEQIFVFFFGFSYSLIQYSEEWYRKRLWGFGFGYRFLFQVLRVGFVGRGVIGCLIGGLYFVGFWGKYRQYNIEYYLRSCFFQFYFLNGCWFEGAFKVGGCEKGIDYKCVCMFKGVILFGIFFFCVFILGGKCQFITFIYFLRKCCSFCFRFLMNLFELLKKVDFLGSLGIGLLGGFI